MMNTDFTVFGWIHALASIVALVVGARVLLRTKGDVTHKHGGQLYFWAMVVTNVTALLIYSQGTVRVFHWMALGTLLLVVLGYLSAHSGKPMSAWLHLHIGSMVVSYYMLIGGTINESFLRLDALRQLTPGRRGIILGITHGVALLVFAAILIYLLTAGRNRFQKHTP